jgi:hypothetical protein
MQVRLRQNPQADRYVVWDFISRLDEISKRVIGVGLL